MRFLCGLFLGLICTFVVHVYSQIVFLDYEQKLVEAKNDAVEAQQTRDHLLSNGRFIRVYDPKKNLNYYKFKAFVTDDNYGIKPKFIASK